MPIQAVLDIPNLGTANIRLQKQQSISQKDRKEPSRDVHKSAHADLLLLVVLLLTRRSFRRILHVQAIFCHILSMTFLTTESRDSSSSLVITTGCTSLIRLFSSACSSSF
jgi:hypothetical protein